MNKDTKALLVITLAFALGMRQMAMTMVMPFISTYCKELSYYTPFLAGMALGIFGLMQALFQIPYGIWSDKKGNKIVMIIGLMQVVIGLVIAYMAVNIYMLILARALQGSGAVLAVGYSWISGKVENPQERLKSMSIVTMIVSAAAAASFAFGSIINSFIPVRKMFLYSAILILLAWFIVLIFLKDNKNEKLKKSNSISSKEAIKFLLKDKCFMALNIGVFINNFIDMGMFFIIPQYLEDITGLDGMWKVFMPSVITAIIVLKVVVKKLDDVKSIKFVIINFIFISLGMLIYMIDLSLVPILIGTMLSLIGYIAISTIEMTLGNNLLENEYRGAGNGILNSIQYIGSFAGPTLTSLIWSRSEMGAILLLTILGGLGAIITKVLVKKDRFKASI